MPKFDEYDEADALEGDELFVVKQGDETRKVTLDSVRGDAGGDGIVESVVAGTGISVDVTDPANPIVNAEVTQSELTNEATLARNADNLTSGTVADARIPAAITRDSEVPGLVPAASASVAGKVELATDAEAVTGTDTARAVTPSGVAAAIGSAITSHSSGITVPSDWGQWWLPKLAGHASAPARIAFVGDSITQGFWASNIVTKSYPGLVTADLQSTYSDGGSGFRGMFQTVAIGGSQMSSYSTSTGQIATSGASWGGASADGPGMATGRAVTSGDTVTFPFRGTSMRLFYATVNTGGSGANRWTYAIDGGSAVTVNAYSASASFTSLTVTGLSSGDHTVVLTMGALSGYMIIGGVAGLNSTGVVGHNLGKSGAGAATFVTAGAYRTAVQQPTWNGGTNLPCDLLVYALAINDAHNGVAVDASVANIRTFLQNTKEASGSLGAMDIVFLLPHIVNYDNATPLYHQYSMRIRDFAASYGAAVVDLWSLYRNNVSYWGTGGVGGGSDGTVSQTSGDDVHPRDVGHQLIADALLSVIKP